MIYGSPALLAGKMLHGEFDATLNCKFSAHLETRGFRQLVGMDELLPNFGVTGPLSMIGYVFDETWAAAHRETISRSSAASPKRRNRSC